jgi:two-component sensor histidine kinase
METSLKPEDFAEQATARFGLMPNLFRAAAAAPGPMEGLWAFAQSAYLDSPLPSLFKERLFVYLSRFCPARYPIVRHSGFLLGNEHGHAAGDPGAAPERLADVMALLSRPLSEGGEREEALARLEASRAPGKIPAPRSERENDLFTALALVFLDPAHSERARSALTQAVGEKNFELLIAFLAFIRAVHFRAETHPELAFEPDMAALIAENGELAHLLLDGSEEAEQARGFSDIATRKRDDEHRKFLENELNHRVKNTLASVQSIATQTLGGATENADLVWRFESRLMALAKAHNLLSRRHWRGAALHELLTLEMEPFGGGERLNLAGDDVQLTPKVALALAMAFHELATNALQYGALSNREGKIEVNAQSRGGGPRRLYLTWRESDGPKVNVPSHRGFGRRLLGAGLAHELAGDVRLEWSAPGVTCTMNIPLDSEVTRNGD